MSDTLPLELVTPERLVLSESVEMVEIPGQMGDFGVLPGHMPFISLIRPGVIRITRTGGEVSRVFVGGGMAEITPDHCTILAEQEIDLGKMTASDAQTRLADARRAFDVAGTDEQKRAAERELKLSEALAEAVAA